MDWYTNQINKNIKLALQYIPLAQGWIKMLTERFKLAFNKAIDKLNQMRITICDIQNRVDVLSFALEVI
jgi:hypothetical protein